MQNNISNKSNPIKVNIVTFIVVVVLHMGVVAGLVTLDMLKPLPKNLEIEKPIEIELLNLSEQPPKRIEDVPNTDLKPESASKSEKIMTEKLKPAPDQTADYKPESKSHSVKKLESKPESKAMTKPQPINKPDFKSEVTQKVVSNPQSVFDNNEHQKFNAIEAQEKLAQEKLAQEKLAQEKLAQEKLAQEKLAQEKLAQEADEDTPQNFSAIDASWKRRPNFVLPPKVLKRAKPGKVFKVSLKLVVDKVGNVSSVSILSSSGNTVVDNAAATAVKKSKLYPFKNKKTGQPVVGEIILPIDFPVEN